MRVTEYEKPRILQKPEKFLPCPFCGNRAAVSLTPYIGARGRGYVAECEFCRAKSGYYVTPEDAIAAWNRRAD